MSRHAGRQVTMLLAQGESAPGHVQDVHAQAHPVVEQQPEDGDLQREVRASSVRRATRTHITEARASLSAVQSPGMQQQPLAGAQRSHAVLGLP